jgi:hypothetical protein
VWCRHHHNFHFLASFDISQLLAFFIEQEGGDCNGNNSANLAGLLFGRLLVDQAHDAQCQRFNATNGALAFTAGADLAAGFAERRAQSLARHFEQSKAGNLAHLNPGTVDFQRFAHFLFNFPLVFRRGHVDEIDDNQPTHVTQAQLAGNLLCCLQIGLKCRFLNVVALGGS